MAKDSASVLIERSPEVGWDWASDLPATFPRWNRGITSFKLLDGDVVKEGSPVRIEGRLLGRTMVTDGQFPVWDRPNRAHFTGTTGKFAIDSVLTVEAVDGGRGSRVSRSYTVGAASGRVARFVAPLLTFMMRQQNKGDLRRLKTLIEAES